MNYSLEYGLGLSLDTKKFSINVNKEIDHYIITIFDPVKPYTLFKHMVKLYIYPIISMDDFFEDMICGVIYDVVDKMNVGDIIPGEFIIRERYDKILNRLNRGLII